MPVIVFAACLQIVFLHSSPKENRLRKCKKSPESCDSEDFLELIARFELATSSLPSIKLAVLACCSLVLFIAIHLKKRRNIKVLSNFPVVSCCRLSHTAVWGFKLPVWVSVWVSVWGSLPRTFLSQEGQDCGFRFCLFYSPKPKDFHFWGMVLFSQSAASMIRIPHAGIPAARYAQSAASDRRP